MNRITKRRKVVNGVKITLLEKSVISNSIVDQSQKYLDIKNEIREYVDEKIENIVIDQSITNISNNLQTIPESLSYVLTKDEILGVIQNTPEDGSVLSYDNQYDWLVWRQSPNVRMDLIDNKLVNYENYFSSRYIFSNKLHLPFAIKSLVSNDVWGGLGKAGIFWGDPWSQTVDNFSIKMGRDDASIGETGYTYGKVGSGTRPVIMKFSNGSEGGRGFVWTSVGQDGSIPYMSLDTNRSILGGGNLTVHNDIISNNGILSGQGIVSHGTIESYGEITSHENIIIDDIDDLPKAFDLRSYYPSVDNTIIRVSHPTTFPVVDELLSYDGYVMTFRHGGFLPNYGTIGLEPPAGGSGGGGTFPGVEIDCGSFLQTDNYCEIDAGSFV